MRRVLGWGSLLLFVAVNLAACASTGADAARTPSLYKRLGGREGIALVVGDFTAAMAAIVVQGSGNGDAPSNAGFPSSE